MSETVFSEPFVFDLAQRAYQSNPTFDIVPDRCALLVIDMQDEFVKPGWTPYWCPEATRQVPRIRQLMDGCRARQIPVIFTVFSRSHHGLDRPVSGVFMPNRYNDLDVDQSSFFVEGKVWHELAPLPGEVVIHKPSYGAFYDTPLETMLKRLGKDTVIISGCMTNFCCGTTARQAYERSFKVVFGSDVNSTDDPDQHEAELRTLRKGFAQVLPAEMIIAAL